ncbi:MAG: hypothetical protein RLZZ158_1887 [Cyanobacteriota bacterium]|jgi:hypothetical protein
MYAVWEQPLQKGLLLVQEPGNWPVDPMASRTAAAGHGYRRCHLSWQSPLCVAANPEMQIFE